MKKLENIQAFGNFKPGDVVEVPDGAVFDTLYFRELPEEKPAKTKKDE